MSATMSDIDAASAIPRMASFWGSATPSPVALASFIRSRRGRNVEDHHAESCRVRSFLSPVPVPLSSRQPGDPRLDRLDPCHAHGRQSPAGVVLPGARDGGAVSDTARASAVANILMIERTDSERTTSAFKGASWAVIMPVPPRPSSAAGCGVARCAPKACCVVCASLLPRAVCGLRHSLVPTKTPVRRTVTSPRPAPAPFSPPEALQNLQPEP